MNARLLMRYSLPVVVCLLTVGCQGLCSMRGVPREQKLGPPYDRPFPLGQVSDSHWETQQTNAEASDFILYDHEFVGNTAKLNTGGKKHLMQMALRLEHVPFPVVVEQTPHNRNPRLDAERRRAVVDTLAQLGLTPIDGRVVVAPAFNEGITASEGEAAYYSTISGGNFGVGGGIGRRFGGRGGVFH
jgi:hypothetical protein